MSLCRIYSAMLSASSHPRQGALGDVRPNDLGKICFFPLSSRDLPPYESLETFDGYVVTEAERYEAQSASEAHTPII